jgi:heptosyltransferase-2
MRDPAREDGATDAPAKILIRLPNWLGDILLARRMLHGLRAARPDARLFAVAPPALLDLLAPEGLFERIHPWSVERDVRNGCLAAVRDFGPEVALVLPPSFSSALFAWRSGARRRVGYAEGVRSFLLTHRLGRGARGDRHLSEEYLAIGAAAGALDATPPDLAPARAGAAEPLIAAAPGLVGRPLAVLGPGAIYGPAKRWSAERFAALGRILGARGFGVAVCGTTAEREVCDAVAAGAGTHATSFAGGTDLPALTALCASAALAVCNDSGLAHLAAATGTPTLALFGSTSSAWTAPLGRRVRVVQHAPECAPCFRRTCRIGYVCLERIEVDEVAAACEELAA